MAVVITRSTDEATVTPDLAEPLDELAAEPQTVVHPILGSSDVDVTLWPASPAIGRVRLLFPSWAAASAALEFHRAAATFSMTSLSMPWLPSLYVPRSLQLVQSREARRRWTLELGYQEIPS